MSDQSRFQFDKVNGSILHVEATSANVVHPASDLNGLRRRNVGMWSCTLNPKHSQDSMKIIDQYSRTLEGLLWDNVAEQLGSAVFSDDVTL